MKYFNINISKDENSHKDFIQGFIKVTNDKISLEDIDWLQKLQPLRSLRNQVEYTPHNMGNNNEYSLQFKFFYSQINRVLDEIMKIG
ncbi:MAG: hypothetical protein PHI32_11065 [Dysgonamonadaceae bacterium]|nr:hypothetical protein [Dysgonamonadaceae bacterium]